MSELWRDIPGYEGRYQVSDLGNVRSLDRYVRLVTRQAGETRRLARGKLLRPAVRKSGHLCVALGRVAAGATTVDVHRLVMLAFEGPCPHGNEVLHLNHNPADNRHINLKYGTRSENLKMDYQVGSRSVHPDFIGARWRK